MICANVGREEESFSQQARIKSANGEGHLSKQHKSEA
jgi:hypothetical protein